MKKILFIQLMFYTQVFHLLIHAQEFSPIQFGNVWVYEFDNGTRYRAEIIDSAIFIDTIKYFGYGLNYNLQYSRIIRLRDDDFFVIREDTTFPEPQNERKYYKDNARLGDSWQVNFSFGIGIYTIIDTFPTFIFDTLVTGKLLNENFGLVEWDYVWTEEFGKLAMFNWLGEVQHYLRGCVINGKVYGDTTFITVSVEDEFKILDQFYLSQNYPNPFNSSTMINFILPEENNIVLELYNIIGQKIKVLLNGFMPSGKHSFQLIAEELVSGTYFYVLRTPGYTETKKMLLLK